MSNRLHFEGVGLQAARSLAGYYVRSPAGVRARPMGYVATWVDPFHELRLYRPFPESYFTNPLGMPAAWSQYISGTASGQTPPDSWRYHVLVTLGQTDDVTVNMGGLGSVFDPIFIYAPEPAYEQLGAPAWIQPLASPTQQFSVTSHRNFRQDFFRCYGQCNQSHARNFSLQSSDQGIVSGTFGSISQTFYNFDSGTHFLEFSFIAPASAAPNVWVDGGSEIIESVSLQRLFLNHPLYCAISTGTGPTYAETGYTTTGLVSEDWGAGYYPGSSANVGVLYTPQPPAPTVSTEVWAWKLFAGVKELSPSGVYDLHFRTDTPGVACVGGIAAIETMSPLDRWRPRTYVP